MDLSTSTPTADWLTGLHAIHKFGELVDVGGTYSNIHHEESKEFSNPYRGRDYDTANLKTPTGLSLYGLNGNLHLDKVQAYGEYLLSQEFHDGKAKEKSGNVAVLNGHWDIIDKWRLGGEFYSIGSRFQTNFTCDAHPNGDGVYANETYGSMGKYQYSLVEDNDDNDEFPENGRSRYARYTKNLLQGDPDGTISEEWDKDKNGIWDYEEDFLNYDADPPESKILFDRNNNGIPDEIEDDAYPDYPYVPGYYLPGERYYRYDKIDDKWENKTADSLTHKGLAGLHLYTRFNLLQNLELTVGGIYDRSQEKTFQMTYVNGIPTKEKFDSERALNLYLLAHYKKPIDRDKYFVVDNFFRLIKDNIPNHTQDFMIIQAPEGETVQYTTVIDNLDYRDMFADALRAEFTLFRNRGFNFSSAGKYEFQKHFPHLEFNYLDKTISSFILIDKLSYIFPFPFFDDVDFLKDMFLIPKFKNIYDFKTYGPRSDSMPDAMLDAKYRCSDMTNMLALVWEWKISEKSAVTVGGQIKRFDDFLNAKENYWEPCYRIQFMLKDRYSGMAVVLTTGFTQYAYRYDIEDIPHNPFNNPHRVMNEINTHEFFIRVHCGI